MLAGVFHFMKLVCFVSVVAAGHLHLQPASAYLAAGSHSGSYLAVQEAQAGLHRALAVGGNVVPGADMQG